MLAGRESGRGSRRRIVEMFFAQLESLAFIRLPEAAPEWFGKLRRFQFIEKLPHLATLLAGQGFEFFDELLCCHGLNLTRLDGNASHFPNQLLQPPSVFDVVF